MQSIIVLGSSVHLNMCTCEESGIKCHDQWSVCLTYEWREHIWQIWPGWLIVAMIFIGLFQMLNLIWSFSKDSFAEDPWWYRFCWGRVETRHQIWLCEWPIGAGRGVGQWGGRQGGGVPYGESCETMVVFCHIFRDFEIHPCPKSIKKSKSTDCRLVWFYD